MTTARNLTGSASRTASTVASSGISTWTRRTEGALTVAHGLAATILSTTAARNTDDTYPSSTFAVAGATGSPLTHACSVDGRIALTGTSPNAG